MYNFKDKVVIVTGATRGIGRAIAGMFAPYGAKLVLTYKQKSGTLNDFSNALVERLDLSDSESIDNLVDQTIRKFSKVDILINCAGIFKQTNFDSISEAELDNMWRINFRGPFLLTQKVFAQMKKQRSGRIINIASVSGKVGSSRAMHYAATKSALITFTRSLARLAGPYGINVNSVAPGIIETEMTKEMLSSRKDFLESLIPLKRIGSPEEVAKVVLFLASDNAGYITGQTICVDGGFCMV